MSDDLAGSVGGLSDQEAHCDEHNTPKRFEPLVLANGASLPLWVCDACDDETDANFASFLDRVREGDFDE